MMPVGQVSVLLRAMITTPQDNTVKALRTTESVITCFVTGLDRYQTRAKAIKLLKGYSSTTVVG